MDVWVLFLARIAFYVGASAKLIIILIQIPLAQVNKTCEEKPKTSYGSILSLLWHNNIHAWINKYKVLRVRNKGEVVWFSVHADWILYFTCSPLSMQKRTSHHHHLPILICIRYGCCVWKACNAGAHTFWQLVPSGILLSLFWTQIGRSKDKE